MIKLSVSFNTRFRKKKREIQSTARIINLKEE